MDEENNKIGRPRTTTPCDEELHKLGAEFVKWASEPSEEVRIRYCQFYSQLKGILKKEWDMILQKEVFREYYEKAQSAIALKWITGAVNPSISHRFIRLYCPDVKQDEDAQVKLQDQIPPKADLVDKENKIMELEAEIAKLRANNKS